MLSESVQALPPVAATVLVAVTGEEVIEEFVDIDQHSFVMRGGVEQDVGGNWCSHLVGLGCVDGSHCEVCRRRGAL